MAVYFLDNPGSLVSPGNILSAEEIQCCYGKHICMSSLEEANFGTYLVSNPDHILITPSRKSISVFPHHVCDFPIRISCVFLVFPMHFTSHPVLAFSFTLSKIAHVKIFKLLDISNMHD